MNKKYILVVMLVVIGALVVSAFGWAAITRFNESQRAQTGDLTSLNSEVPALEPNRQGFPQKDELYPVVETSAIGSNRQVFPQKDELYPVQ